MMFIGVMGFCVVVQSSSKSPDFLQKREEFFLDHTEKLKLMDEADFQKYVEGFRRGFSRLV